MTQPAINAFTAPSTIRWARHEQAQVTRNTGQVSKSICIHPPVGTLAEREARGALFESQRGVVDKFKRALHKR